MRSVSTVWAGLTPVQRALVAAVVGIAAILGGLKATSWAENSLGRPRYEVVWETELPASDRAYATATTDGRYVVVLQTTTLKRLYKLSASGQIEWQLEWATKTFNPAEGIYTEALEISGLIPTAGGGVMVHGDVKRVLFPPGIANLKHAAYVASISSDGALQWRREIQPTGRESVTSIGFSDAVPLGDGGLFFGNAAGEPSFPLTNQDKQPPLQTAWWIQLSAEGKTVAEHFDLEGERAGLDTSLRTPVWENGVLYALRGGHRAADLTTRKRLPYGTDAFETIVNVDPASGAVRVRADLPYTCIDLHPTPTGMFLHCYDRKLDLAVASVLAVWIDRDFRTVAAPVVWDRANPREGLGGRFTPEGVALAHGVGSRGAAAVGGQQVRIGLLNQSGQVIVWRRFYRLLSHSQAWALIRGLDTDALLLVRTEYARYDLPLKGRTLVTLLRFVP